jgi:hypothetical protein
MWDELGIAPCDDPKAIRRAYAARLKKLDPDADPESFARLRAAFEWALAHGTASIPSEPRAAEPEASESANIFENERESDSSADDVPIRRATNGAVSAHEPPASDEEDVRDRAVLIALEASLRRRAADEAIALYYRAAATGALSFETAPDVLERVLALAAEDRTLDVGAFRQLARAASLDAPRLRNKPTSALQQRVLTRLAAENWYDGLVAAAGQRKGRAARRRAKISRYLLGRIGRYRHPRIDLAALKTWLAQYRQHQAWLDDRIDPAWIAKIDRRLRRRNIFWLCFYGFFIASILIDFAAVSMVSLVKGDVPFLGLTFGGLMVVFFSWILMLIFRELKKLLFQRGG